MKKLTAAQAILLSFVSLIIGGFMSLMGSRYYYLKSTESSRLVINTMAAFLEKHMGEGRTLFNYDKHGNIIGLRHFTKDAL